MRDSLRLASHGFPARFTSSPRGSRFSNGPADDDGRSADALSHLHARTVLALPACTIQKKPFFCIVTPRPSWQHTFPRFPLSLSISLSFSRAHSRHFPGFSFHYTLSLLRPPAFLSALPFFPGTSLSTRLTPPLVVYLESSITCT